MSKSVLVIETPRNCSECPMLTGNDECILQDDDINFNADTLEQLIQSCPLKKMTKNEIKDYLEDLITEGQYEGDKIIARDDEEALRAVIKALEEIQQYRVLGTVKEFHELKERQIPKKQSNIDDYESHFRLSKAGFLYCCNTNKDIRYPLISLTDLDYCPRCGQAIDWSNKN